MMLDWQTSKTEFGSLASAKRFVLLRYKVTITVFLKFHRLPTCTGALSPHVDFESSWIMPRMSFAGPHAPATSFD